MEVNMEEAMFTSCRGCPIVNMMADFLIEELVNT